MSTSSAHPAEPATPPGPGTGSAARFGPPCWIAIAILVLGLLGGCARPERVLRYDDLVASDAEDLPEAASPVAEDPGPRARRGARPPARDFNGAACADRVRWSRKLVDGQTLHLERPFGSAPRLVVVYCRPGKGPGELLLRGLGPDGGALLEERVEVTGWPSWRRWEVDLAPLAEATGEVRLEVSLPPRVELRVSEAFVEHRTDEAAGWSGPAVWVEAEQGLAEPPPGRAARRPPAAVAIPEPLRPEVVDPASATDPAAAPEAGPGRAASTEAPADPLEEGGREAASSAEVDAEGGGRRATAADLAGRQILLISVDTLRWDALETRLADGAPLMPHVAALASDGEVFQPHYAGGAWTKPSHAALLTGYPLSVHGADGDEGTLDAAVPTLAERMSAAGLATAAVVHDCVWLNPKFGFHRGFDRYRSTKGGAGPAVRDAVNWIAEHRGQPFFFFFHTFDVHSDFQRLPYEATGSNTAAVEALFGVRRYGCRRGECASGLLAAIGRRGLEPLPGEAEILRHLYGAGAREVDAELGRLFQALRELGLYDDLTIVFTSDHGEMMLEHGDTLHGITWEEVLRVPLVVKWPGGESAGERTGVPTSSVDVAATLLAQAGGDDSGLPGVDLRRPRRDRPLFVGSTSWWVVYQDGWKAQFFTHGDRRHLYHLAEDPGELRDLARRRPEVLEGLRGRMEEMLAWAEGTRSRLAAGQAQESPLTPEERDRLRALGYLQ